MINKVYFSDKGLTSTSANHIANLAKELCHDLEVKLQNVDFVSTSINLIGDTKQSIINTGTTSLDWIPEAIDKIAKVNSLIAWLREAIKERTNALNKIKTLTLKTYAEFVGIEYPECPEGEYSLTEDEYYASLSVKERNRYYSLEAQAATIGKYIHPDGSLNEARKKLSEKIQKPHLIKEQGRDTILYNYTPTISLEESDNLFFELQTKHREIQAQLNQIKFECEKAVKASQIKVAQEYQQKNLEYASKIKEIDNQMNIFIAEQTKFIGDLKIVIPNDLKDIYEEVSKLGK